MSTARESVIEMRSTPANAWWVSVLDDPPVGRPLWTWVRDRRRATTWPTKKDADRFRVDHCIKYLSGYERRITRVRDAS